ncbi:unnamed protein product [Pleuronectes platessa]|uniref:Uncharacterized protein n=1 Tax=Pleuronectes platessa TaxID=8262 RepID=A0A9N7W559_PLEPL|nr:unnamed protein product [Pleuronectes platessa]
MPLTLDTFVVRLMPLRGLSYGFVRLSEKRGLQPVPETCRKLKATGASAIRARRLWNDLPEEIRGGGGGGGGGGGMDKAAQPSGDSW